MPGELYPPFLSGTEFWCSQGGRSSRGRTHSFQGDIFALDLASSADSGDVSVVAPVSGDVYVYDGCDERDSSQSAVNNSHCGLGYGNHVKIWDGTYIYLLGHLARVTVTPGRVNRDEIIGTMGCSGSAGRRHVHFTVTGPASRTNLKEILSTPGWKGEIPVRFRLSAHQMPGGGPLSAWSDALPCADVREQTVVLMR